MGRKSARGGANPYNSPRTACQALNVSAIIDSGTENRSGRLRVRPGAIPLQDFLRRAQLSPFAFKCVVRLAPPEPRPALRIALLFGFLCIELAPLGIVSDAINVLRRPV